MCNSVLRKPGLLLSGKQLTEPTDVSLLSRFGSAVYYFNNRFALVCSREAICSGNPSVFYSSNPTVYQFNGLHRKATGKVEDIE